MKNISKLNSLNNDQLDMISSSGKKIEDPLFFDSKSYSPYKWSIFFFYLGVVAASGWFLFKYYWIGNIPPSRLRDWMIGSSWVGEMLGLPVSIYYFLNLFFPTQLLIDKVGITLWRCGIRKNLIWTDIKSINIQDVSSGKYNKPILWIIIYGKSSTLRCPPYFGVDQSKILQVLHDQISFKT